MSAAKRQKRKSVTKNKICYKPTKQGMSAAKLPTRKFVTNKHLLLQNVSEIVKKHISHP